MCNRNTDSFLTADNDVFTWGKSSRGRLGRSIEFSHLPTLVALPKDEDQFSVVSLSSSHSSTVIATQPINRSSSPM
uniref:Uncharacterized protein n=1 Tax=Arion vulgaris TaxID=1028688 RepID=A0A0B7AV78_9EUPU